MGLAVVGRLTQRKVFKILARAASVVVAMTVAVNSHGLKAGDAFPELMGRYMNGNGFYSSDLPSGAKVVNFFWVECQPCKKELPLLARKQAQYPDVSFIAAHPEPDPETGEDYERSVIKAFVDGLPAAPRHTIALTHRAKEQYGIDAYPITLLINAEDKVEAVLRGLDTNTINTLERWLRQQ